MRQGEFEEFQFKVTITLLLSNVAKNKLNVYFDYFELLLYLFKGHVLSLYASNSHIITEL